MEISVKLYEHMKQYAPRGQTSFAMTLDETATVGDVLKSLCVPEKTQKVILVNGRHAHRDTPLKDASTVVIFPPVSGG